MMKPRYRREAAASDTSGRITGIEAVAYTAFLLLVGAVAAGWFDAMVPWK